MQFIVLKNTAIFGFLCCISILILSCNSKNHKVQKEDIVLRELQSSLEVLANTWYPRTVDSVGGGFYPDFNYKWDLEGEQSKMLVTQARHLWTTSTLFSHFKDSTYLELAVHAFQFLSKEMQDVDQGGFYTLLKSNGKKYVPVSKTKSAYANAFAIYGLATYYKVSRDTSALNLAKKTFLWLDQNAYDTLHKGYFDVLQLDGSNLLNVETNEEAIENWIRKDWKDQNSSIHLMEAFSALYEVWPDKRLEKKLRELQLLIRDTITSQKGYLYLHLERDWTPVVLKDSSDQYWKDNFWIDHVSFGHDVETGFLLLEASHVLHSKNDTVTRTKAKKMIDHGIAKGWDYKRGGFFDGGYYLDETDECTILNPTKIWWTQAEGLNALLLMATLYPEEENYKKLFIEQWSYIQKELVDDIYGGWFIEGVEGNEEIRKASKAHNWKVNYHNVRALINCIKMLEGTYELTDKK